MVYHAPYVRCSPNTQISSFGHEEEYAALLAAIRTTTYGSGTAEKSKRNSKDSRALG